MTAVVPVKASAAEIITVETTPVATKISAVVNERSAVAIRSYITSRRPETIDPDAVGIIVAVRPEVPWSWICGPINCGWRRVVTIGGADANPERKV